MYQQPDDMPENLLPFQGEVLLFKHFFPKAESEKYFRHLLDQVPWKQQPIKLYGKEVMQPRLTAWYGEMNKPYSYSGITMAPYAWTCALLEIKDKVEKMAGKIFTSALLNLYRHGKDSMGWHRDNEKELGENPVIGSVSFGASRVFQLRNYENKKVSTRIELTDGSLLLMRGETQHYWEHALLKTLPNTAARINITFRYVR